MALPQTRPAPPATQPARPLLHIQNVYAAYPGGDDILRGVSMEVYPGEIVCVIGPNGAGKSTVFKAVYGFVRVRQGTIWFNGQDITNWPPSKVIRAGLAMVPQLPSIFPQMTVYENLEMGLFLERDKKLIQERIEYVFELFPRLKERSHVLAESLSGGERRMLEIGRALLIRPKMLMLDEPSAGLAPLITRMLFQVIQELNAKTGLTILMIEQNARQGLSISHRGYVLELGRVTYQGAAQELLENPKVRRAFLGIRGE